MGHEGHGLFFAVGEDLIGYLVDEEVEACKAIVSVCCGCMIRVSLACCTFNQTLHLILPPDLDAEHLGDPVVVLESTAPRRQNAQLFGLGAMLLLVGLQFAHKLDAGIDALRLKLEEVQPATERVVARFAREVDELGQRASNLDDGRRVSIPCMMTRAW